MEIKQTEPSNCEKKSGRSCRPHASRCGRVAACRRFIGDAAPVGEGVSELRIHYGPGLRVYFQQRGADIIVLLCGGDKGSQSRDISAAKRLAMEWNR